MQGRCSSPSAALSTRWRRQGAALASRRGAAPARSMPRSRCSRSCRRRCTAVAARFSARWRRFPRRLAQRQSTRMEGWRDRIRVQWRFCFCSLRDSDRRYGISFDRARGPPDRPDRRRAGLRPVVHTGRKASIAHCCRAAANRKRRWPRVLGRFGGVTDARNCSYTAPRSAALRMRAVGGRRSARRDPEDSLRRTQFRGGKRGAPGLGWTEP